MKKIINNAMFILLLVGLIFGTWVKGLYFQYTDNGLTPPQSTFCLYDHIQTFLAGIVSIWAGVSLICKPADFVKLFGKIDSPVQLVSVMCFGLFWLAGGILCFWNIFTSNLSYCCK